jgi:peptidylprolyl isomerase
MTRRPLPLFIFAVLCTVGLGACSSGASTSTTTSSANSTSSAPVPAVSNGADINSAPGVSADSAVAPTTLLTKDLVVGTGATAGPSSTVVVQYIGASYRTGKVFNSTWQLGQPATFSLLQVIPGFAKGIEGMKVGGRREIVIPSSLGYGPSGSPPAIAPNETLVFIVDLKSVS